MQLHNLRPDFFQDEPLPEATSLVGWSALACSLGIRAPVRNLACVSERHVRGNRREDGPWTVFDKRYLPEDTLEGHLNFALNGLGHGFLRQFIALIFHRRRIDHGRQE